MPRQLPTDADGTPLLGKGEVVSSVTPAIVSEMTITTLTRDEKFDAYVITDYPVDIRFGLQDGKIALSGDFYVHFWRRDEAKFESITKQYASKRVRQSELEALREKYENALDEGRVVIHAKELSDRVYENRELVRSLNPVVYQATNNVMRCSAFFRYCKQQNPGRYRAFLKQIANIEVLPEVMTPNVIEKPGD